MIASIEGRVADKQKDHLIVVVNGIGYRVYTPVATLTRAEGEIHLHTTLIVREDALTLYGFETATERGLFETLIGVSGVGPRLGVAILSTLSPDNLRNAVTAERADALTRVPGIGKKTAQKIVFELKDKFITMDTIPIDIIEDDVNSDVLDALIALGYSVVEAQSAIQALPSDAPDEVEERVRLALQSFL